MNLYFVKDWQQHFETTETRKLAKLRWWPKPNKHDGLGFRRMAAQNNRCELYAAWNLILDIASKTQPQARRGYLERDGIPLSPGDMGLSAGFPGEVFETALEFFSSPLIQWLCVESAGEPGNVPGEPGNVPAEGRKEGIEGRKGASLGDKDKGTDKEEGTGGTAGPSKRLAEVFDTWNASPKLVKVLVLSDKRRHLLSVRLAEPFFSEHWPVAIKKISASAFCRGENDRGWKADFDFFLRPDTVAKVMEGKYDGKQNNNSIPFGSTIAPSRPFVMDRGGQL